MSSSNQRWGVSIRVFLVDGAPEGLRHVTKSNWNGLGVMCSRAQYPEARRSPEFERPGVYLLVGPSPSGSNSQSIYIGHADSARERLDNHHRNRDAWSHLILFTSQDDYFNKAHVQYLESRLIELAIKARRVDVENGNAPRLPSLSAADRADAEVFLEDMLLIYPVLGVSAFEVVSHAPSPSALKPKAVVQAVPRADSQRPRLRLRASGAEAVGEDTPEGFLVFQGAVARIAAVASLQEGYRSLRRRLREMDVFADRDGKWITTQDYAFDSPTQAAAVLTGRPANGQEEWKDDRGRSLRELRELALQGAIDVE